MEAIYSSETLVDFQRTTRLYIPEDSTLDNHRCENCKIVQLLTGARSNRYYWNRFYHLFAATWLSDTGHPLWYRYVNSFQREPHFRGTEYLSSTLLKLIHASPGVQMLTDGRINANSLILCHIGICIKSTLFFPEEDGSTLIRNIDKHVGFMTDRYWNGLSSSTAPYRFSS
jgi:hypothetical protein